MAAQKVQQRTAGGITYTLTRRRVRNINLRVRADGSVAASAAVRVPVSYVDAFVAARADWVRSAQARAAVRREREEAERPELPAKADALAHMQALCRVYYPQFAASCPGGRMPKIAVRDMTTRWGVCAPGKRRITLNLRLAARPQEQVEYVVLHEYCHFVHPNHQAEFWALMTRLMPDWKQRRKALRE